MLWASKFPSSSTATAASTACGDLTALSFAENWISLAEVHSLSDLDDAFDSDEDFWEFRCGLLAASEACSLWRPCETTQRRFHGEATTFERPDMRSSAAADSISQARATARSDVSVNGSVLTMLAWPTRASLSPLKREAIEEDDEEELDEEDQERLKLYSAVFRLKVWMAVLDCIGAEQAPLDDDVLVVLSMVGTS